MRKLHELARGEFLERAENALAFGLPGVGKSHAACAIGNALIEQGHSVLFRPAYQLVQELLAAKRDPVLPQKLRRLDSFDLLILDDIGYVKQSPEEAEVMFTLIAERYERRSMLIHQQSGVQRLGANLQRPDGNRGSHRSPGPSRGDSGVQRAELSHQETPANRCRSGRRNCGCEGWLMSATVLVGTRCGSQPEPLIRRCNKERGSKNL